MTSSDRRLIPYAAYIHIPFCLSKCLYCDFNSYADRNDIFDAYADSIIQDISNSPMGPALETVYFGGGTPTVLGAARLCDILQAIIRKYALVNDVEVSVEANPGTVTNDMLAWMREAGFNRVSIGAQSFEDHFLKMLGRAHDVEQISAAVSAARSAGFESISLDLMYGLPNQSLRNWLIDLDQAVSLGVEHISAYELTIEDDTPLARSLALGGLQLPSENVQIDMVTQAQTILVNAGYERYEVSNYCKPGYECRHNVKYWHNEAHWGFGSGAVGYYDGARRVRIMNPDAYIECLKQNEEPVQSSEAIAGRLLEAETLMMGLRLSAGVEVHTLNTMSKESQDTAKRLVDCGLLVVNGEMIKTTPEGYLKLNDVAESFLP